MSRTLCAHGKRRGGKLSFSMIDSILSFLYGDKLAADVREPVFAFDLAHLLGGPANEGVLSFGILMPNPAFWIQLLSFMVLGVMLGLVASVVNYNLIVLRRRPSTLAVTDPTIEAMLIAFGITIPLCIAFPYVIIDAFGVRNYVIKFCLATISPVLTMFHSLEAVFGTSPRCSETSFARYALYMASPLEISFDQRNCRPIKVKVARTLRALGDFVLFLVVLGLYQSIFGPSRYQPFATGNKFPPLDSYSHSLKHLFNLGHLGNNLVAALLLQLYLTTFCLGLQAVTNLVAGIETKRVMSDALFGSSSPSEFWGRNWNTLIHGVLKRAIYKPALRYLPKAFAAIAAFLFSGLFHEYILSALFYFPNDEIDSSGQCQHCYVPSYGRNVIFFLINAFIIAAEHKVGGASIFAWIKSNLPIPMVSLLVVSTALPFAHFFTADYILSDYFLHGRIGFPLIVSLQ